MGACSSADRSAQTPEAMTGSARGPVADDEHVVRPESIGLHWSGKSPLPEVRAGSYRLWDSGTTWRQIEPDRPSNGSHTYQWQRLDRLVQQMLDAGASPLVVLGTPPAWAVVDDTFEGHYGAGAASPPRLEDWRTYVRATAEHLRSTYGEQVREFQIWNEPNLPGFFSGTPAELAELTTVAAQELRRVLPEAVVVGPGVAGRQSNAMNWLDEFLSAGGGQEVDVVAAHLYPPKGGTPLDGLTLMAGFRQVMAKHGIDKPVWDTEVNYGGKADDFFYPETEGAELLAQTYVLAASAGIERTYWYAWENRTWPGIWTVAEDGETPTAAGRAIGHAAEQLVGARVTSCAAAQEVVTCDLERPDGNGTVAWTTGPPKRWTLPEGAGSVSRFDGTAVDRDGAQDILLDGHPVVVKHP